MSDDPKRITILHSNDIHGKFTGETGEDGKLRGSMAQVAGLVAQTKKDNPNTLYCIAGDVFQGSLIDSDYQGLSTIDILNLIDIDVMSLGNHELDYGISHILFAGRCANFDVINANFLVKSNRKHLFKPYYMAEIDGIIVLFIGLLTENIIDQTRAEGLVGRYVTVADAREEIRRTYSKLEKKSRKADVVVLLTHIGWEADLELARSLDEEFDVDVIIGGHSHTYIEEPVIENGILVLQCGSENTHIGKLDFIYNKATDSVEEYSWEMIPVDEDHCPADKYVRAMINTYEYEINNKYSKMVTTLKRPLDNYGRGNPTEVGQLFADVFADALGLDLMCLAASSLRCYSLNADVTLEDLKEAYPYDGKIYCLEMSGEQLKRGITHMMRSEVLEEWQETFFHFSKRLKIDFDFDSKNLILEFDGMPLEDDRMIQVGMQEYYLINSDIGFGIKPEELVEEEEGIWIASPDAFLTLQDYLSEHQKLGRSIDNRCVIRGNVGGLALEVKKGKKKKGMLI
ncbi:MAG: bifunctional metallophosphatase/5'-nucleotidase [Mogibacterium sp.]|nr:bifunctional metallophosphatase/5'-nucleotidase [Mogibacterium sp.]